MPLNIFAGRFPEYRGRAKNHFSIAMTAMPAPTLLPDDVADADGTYFERHEDYERRLRENSHRWFVPRMVPFSLLWQKRLVVTGGICSALGETALLSYLVYLMANGELVLLLSHVAKQSAVVAGTGLILVAFVTMVSFRMPLCVIYFESVLILSTCVLQGYLTVMGIVMFPAIPDDIRQAWAEASGDVRVAVQLRYSCERRLAVLHHIVSDRFKQHLTAIVAIQSLVVALTAGLGLARSISKQSSFRIL